MKLPCIDSRGTCTKWDFFLHTVQTVSLSAGSDIFAQKVMKVEGSKYKLRRTIDFSVVALIYVSPVGFLWNKWLLHQYGTSTKAILVKILLDQFLFAPVSLLFYLFTLEMVRGRSCKEALQFLRCTYFSVLIPSNLFKPFMHVIIIFSLFMFFA